MTNEEIKKITEIDERGKSNTHRLDKVEERQDKLDKLVTSVSVMATKQETIETDVTEIKADVKTLTSKPGKRWDTFIDKLFWLVVAAAFGFLFAQIGIVT